MQYDPELRNVLQQLSQRQLEVEDLGDWLAVHIWRLLNSPSVLDQQIVAQLNDLHSNVANGRAEHSALVAFANKHLRESVTLSFDYLQPIASGTGQNTVQFKAAPLQHIDEYRFSQAVV